MKVAHGEAAREAVQDWLSQQATATQAALLEGQATAMAFVQEPPDEETTAYVAHWLQILHKAIGALHSVDLLPRLREGQDTATEPTNVVADNAGGAVAGGQKPSAPLPDNRPIASAGGVPAPQQQRPGQPSGVPGATSPLAHGMVETFRPESAGSAHHGEAVRDMDIDTCGPGVQHPGGDDLAVPAVPARRSSSRDPEQAGSSPAERSAAAPSPVDPRSQAVGSALPNGPSNADRGPGAMSHGGEEPAATRQEEAAGGQPGQAWCGGGSRIAEPSALALACPADVNPFTLAEALDALRELGALHLPLATLHASGLMTTVKDLMTSKVCLQYLPSCSPLSPQPTLAIVVALAVGGLLMHAFFGYSYSLETV